MIVVDASLAAKWQLSEPETSAARGFLAQHAPRLTAPDLLLSEVAGALVRAANMRALSATAVSGLIDIWRALWDSGAIAPRRLDTSVVSAAARLALALGHSLADCVYLALAVELDCELATCDRKFVARAARLYPRVRLLEDYGT